MPTTYEQVTYNSADGAQIGAAPADKVAFYGAVPVAQRAAAAQATSLISVTSTAVNTSIVAWMLEVSNTLTALGLWKGAA